VAAAGGTTAPSQMEHSVGVAGALLQLVHLGAARIVVGLCFHESAYIAAHAEPGRRPLVTR
jgi:hypothetical protein